MFNYIEIENKIFYFIFIPFFVIAVSVLYLVVLPKVEDNQTAQMQTMIENVLISNNSFHFPQIDEGVITNHWKENVSLKSVFGFTLMSKNLYFINIQNDMGEQVVLNVPEQQWRDLRVGESVNIIMIDDAVPPYVVYG